MKHNLNRNLFQSVLPGQHTEKLAQGLLYGLLEGVDELFILCSLCLYHRQTSPPVILDNSEEEKYFFRESVEANSTFCSVYKLCNGLLANAIRFCIYLFKGIHKNKLMLGAENLRGHLHETVFN